MVTREKYSPVVTREGLFAFYVARDGQSAHVTFDEGDPKKAAHRKIRRTSRERADVDKVVTRDVRIPDESYIWMLVRGNELMNKQRKVYQRWKAWRDGVERARARRRRPTEGQQALPV